MIQCSAGRTVRAVRQVAAPVGGSLLDVLYLEYRFDAVFALDGEIVEVLLLQVVFDRLLLHEFLTPFVRLVVVLAVEIRFQQHRLCRTFGRASEVGGIVFAFVPKSRLGIGEVGYDSFVNLFRRCARLYPVVRRFDRFRYERHSAEQPHETEIVVRPQEFHFAQQARVHPFGREFVGHGGNHLYRLVGACYALELGTVEIEYRRVVRCRAEIGEVVEFAAVLNRFAAFDGVVRTEVAEYPFAVVTCVPFPCERHVHSVGELYGSRFARQEVVFVGAARCLLGEPVMARSERECGDYDKYI